MGTEILNPFSTVANEFLAYLPGLLAGIGLAILGLISGWLAKRFIIQFAILLRVDRMFSRSRWREQFKRADVRFGIFSLAGNGIFALVFLIFMDNALIAWKLTLLSDLLGKAILFLPRFIIAAIIFAAGWYVAKLCQRYLSRILEDEGLRPATLVARFVRIVLVVLFSAMAIVELDVAREIVIIGFTTIMVTLGAVSTAAIIVGGKEGLARDSIKLDEHSGGAGED